MILTTPRTALLALLSLALACESAPPEPAQPGEHGAHSAPAEFTFGAPLDEGDGEDEAAAQEWDVEAPPGPTRAIQIDTRTGTWMNLDVSPDGRTIAFDMLGDLYVLPIRGGQASALTHGMSWDMQPRYSPDGRTIAFTSDRAGGDNIWVVQTNGQNARQVTDETFRLPNSPVWTPDGEFIAARKHFSSRRSLGTGEIWLWHESGGSGLQMTEKTTDQKDIGEPAFSPDGRYVYYSRDATPGKYFEYSKNPHAEIYVIDRLDRETGRIDTGYINGVGGSCRPTPSPDGKRIAFVRRVHSKTAIFLHDIESGDEWQLWDGLERDMQETWAIHGVYAAMAWTPDGAALIAWAGGRLWNVNAETGEPTEIPFHVQDERTVSEPLREPLAVDADEFQTRMLRWPSVSPDGNQVVYSAVGQLWIESTEGGDARRLTSDEGHFEYYPSWSRDGASIVFVSWSDADLGAVRVVPAAGGASRAVTAEKGHFVQPAFSPDGSQITYLRAGGERLNSPTWSRETGIYVIPSAGGEATRMTRGGVRPHFGADAERLFYMDWEAEDARVLKSIDFATREERVHLRSEAASNFRVSPDGEWVAFTERFHAFVAPFPPTGRTVKIGPKTDGVPQARVSKRGADFLHWSANSRSVHWVLGPELFTRELSETFAFLEGAPPRIPDAPEHGVAIGPRLPVDKPDGRVAFVNGRVVTMNGDEVFENGTVVVQGNRIISVTAGPAPESGFIVDCSGKTILPGLIDVHAHGPQGEHGMQPQQNWLHYSMLSFGVTTVHDPSNDTHDIFTSSELARAGSITSPRTYSTGTILYGAKGSFAAKIDSLEDAVFHLDRLQSVGAFSVKSYNQPRRDQRQMVIAAGRQLGMEVVPEGGSLFQHNMSMVIDGHTGIEHSIPVPKVYDDVLQVWGGTPVGYTPTLGVAYGGVWGENYWYQNTSVGTNERLSTFVPREVIDRASIRGERSVQDGDWNHIRAAGVAKALYDVGVHVNLGAHGQREGLAAHWEMWMMVQGGMTPHEALRCGTTYGAGYIGADSELGTLEAGKLADIIVVDGNPLEDIRLSENIDYTMINGRLYDARTMNEIGNHPRERAPFFWER